MREIFNSQDWHQLRELFNSQDWHPGQTSTVLGWIKLILGTTIMVEQSIVGLGDTEADDVMVIIL